MLKVKSQSEEDHCCDDDNLKLDKYLQLGSGAGRYLLAVGESPAANGWYKSGRAFFTTDGKVVPTGKNFLINLKQIDDDLNLENISFTEIAKCFIGANRKKLHTCAAKVWPHFIEQLNYVKPRIIILLGKNTTDIFNILACTSLIIGRIQKVKISSKSYNILPLYHPSPLNPKRVQNIEFIERNVIRIRELLKL
jgi:uracil-DNA glycosylase family 4